MKQVVLIAAILNFASFSLFAEDKATVEVQLKIEEFRTKIDDFKYKETHMKLNGRTIITATINGKSLEQPEEKFIDEQRFEAEKGKESIYTLVPKNDELILNIEELGFNNKIIDVKFSNDFFTDALDGFSLSAKKYDSLFGDFWKTQLAETFGSPFNDGSKSFDIDFSSGDYGCKIKSTNDTDKELLKCDVEITVKLHFKRKN